MSQLQREQHQIMQKEEEQRQRLTRQQLDSHTEQQQHLQTLQRNLEERQQALDQQIKENIEQRHKNLLQTNQGLLTSASLLGSQHLGQELETGHMTQKVRGQESDSQQEQNIVADIQGLASPHKGPLHAGVQMDQFDSEQMIVQNTQEISIPYHQFMHLGHHSEQADNKQHILIGRKDEPPAVQLQNQPSNEPNSMTSPLNSQATSVTDPNRILPDATPEQHHPTTSERNSKNNRIRNYQLKLLSQQQQSRNALLEAQARLQQRRMNLLKEYPELTLPEYSPYVSGSARQEASVIYSQAERDLGPVSVESERYMSAPGHIAGIQSDANMPVVGHSVGIGNEQKKDAVSRTSVPEESGFSSTTSDQRNNVLLRSLPQEGGFSHLESEQREHATLQTSFQHVLGFSDTDQPTMSSSTGGNVRSRAPDGQDPAGQIVGQDPAGPMAGRYRTLSNVPSQPEQSIVYGILPQSQRVEPPVVTTSDQQTVFKDFLREQKQKLEQRNKEHETRLKQKQEQLREQIKRQMEQYRDVFLSQWQGAPEEQDLAEESVRTQSSHRESKPSNVLPDLFSRLSTGEAQSPEDPQLLQGVLTLANADVQRPMGFPSGPLVRSHHRPPPIASRLFPAQGQNIQPHELSTIIEVDTPKSERKTLFTRSSPQSPESKSLPVSQNVVGLGYHQYHRGHLSSENVKDQDLLAVVQRDMVKVLDDDEVTIEAATRSRMVGKSPDVARSKSGTGTVSFDAGKQMIHESPDKSVLSRSTTGLKSPSTVSDQLTHPRIQFVTTPEASSRVGFHSGTGSLPGSVSAAPVASMQLAADSQRDTQLIGRTVDLSLPGSTTVASATSRDSQTGKSASR